jgi:hypothetical protein
MIRSEKMRKASRQREDCPVREFVGRARRDQPFAPQQIEISVERDTAECQHRARPKQGELLFEIGRAIANLFRQRLVVRRSAPDRGRNKRVLESEAVARVLRLGLVGKARTVKLRVEKIAGTVSGEHAPRPVRAMSGRRQTDDHQFGLRVAEGRHGPPPVGPIAVRAALSPRNLLAVAHQPRALPARRDFAFERG